MCTTHIKYITYIILYRYIIYIILYRYICLHTLDTGIAEEINKLEILPKQGRSWTNPFTHTHCLKRIISRRHMKFEPNKRSYVGEVEKLLNIHSFYLARRQKIISHSYMGLD